MTRGPGRRTLLALISGSVMLAVAVVGAVWATSSPGAATGTARAANAIEPHGDMTVTQVPRGRFTPSMVDQEDLVAASIDDISAFWSEQLPALTGAPFEHLRGGVTAVDSAADSGDAPCVSRPPDITGNAYYCPSQDGIVYDAAALVPVLLHRYGVGGLIATFAHEYGHGVEARLAAGSRAAVSNLTSEARADCNAGAFVAWAADGHADHISLDASGVLGAIGPLVDFADSEAVTATDPTAHGFAVDRVSWFALGYRDGASACAEMTATRTASTRFLASPSDGGDDTAAPALAASRYSTAAMLLQAAEESVSAFAGTAARPATTAVLDSVAARGQFAQATAVALATGSHLGDGGLIAAACFAGAWAASTYGSAPPGELGSWPGDADEGLVAVLASPGASFDAAVAYVDGFDGGRTACG